MGRERAFGNTVIQGGVIMNRPVAGTVEHQAMRRRQVACIVALLVLFALLLTVVGYFCLFCSVPLEISKETTYLTEPLTPDGKKVDYLAAWEKETYPDNMATDENGYRLIVRHLGVAKDALPAQAPVICQKLGLAESNLSEMPLEEPYEFLAAYVASDAFDPAVIEALRKSPDEEEQYGGMGEGEPELAFVLEERLARPWTLDDLPMMERWLEENGPAIDLVAEAVRKPTFRIPLTPPESGPLIGMFPSEYVRFRSFARCLTARARYRIGSGDIDGAINDLVTCKRLGRHLERSGLILSTLVGIAIEGMADAIGIAGSLEHLPTDEQFKRLVGELNDLAPRADIKEIMRFERYVALDLLQYMAENPAILGEMGLPVSMPRHMGLDWSMIARRFNEHFDTILAGGGPPSPSPNAMAIVSRFARGRRWWRMHSARLCLRLLPPFSRQLSGPRASIECNVSPSPCFGMNVSTARCHLLTRPMQRASRCTRGEWRCCPTWGSRGCTTRFGSRSRGTASSIASFMNMRFRFISAPARNWWRGRRPIRSL